MQALTHNEKALDGLVEGLELSKESG